MSSSWEVARIAMTVRRSGGALITPIAKRHLVEIIQQGQEQAASEDRLEDYGESLRKLSLSLVETAVEIQKGDGRSGIGEGRKPNSEGLDDEIVHRLKAWQKDGKQRAQAPAEEVTAKQAPPADKATVVLMPTDIDAAILKLCPGFWPFC